MNTAQDDGKPRDVHDEIGPPASLTLEKLLQMTPFPIYGLIDYPNDLMLQSLSYSTAAPGPLTDESGAPLRTHLPHVLWQASLHYSYLPTHERAGQRIDLTTLNLCDSPMPAPEIADLEQAHAVRFQSYHAMPPLVAAQPTSFLIERFPLLEGTAVAVVEYSPHAPPRGRLLGRHAHYVPDALSTRPRQVMAKPRTGPTWSVTLRSPQLWVGACATGWTSDELFDILERLAVISQRPEVLTRYERELGDWQRYVHSH